MLGGPAGEGEGHPDGVFLERLELDPARFLPDVTAEQLAGGGDAVRVDLDRPMAEIRLGMDAVWRIEVEDFPASVVVDDKGNDFFAEVAAPALQVAFRR